LKGAASRPGKARRGGTGDGTQEKSKIQSCSVAGSKQAAREKLLGNLKNRELTSCEKLSGEA